MALCWKLLVWFGGRRSSLVTASLSFIQLKPACLWLFLATSLFFVFLFFFPLRLFFCYDSTFCLTKCEVCKPQDLCKHSSSWLLKWMQKQWTRLYLIYKLWDSVLELNTRGEEGNWLLRFCPGIDKENVELSPTTGHCNSGRTRHGSASQVQKQRSAGSFKRNSIKKIVWSFLSFLFQTDLTDMGSSLVTPHHRAVMLHFMFLTSPSSLPCCQMINSWKHCLNLMLLFSLTFFFTFGVSGLSKCSEQLQREWAVRTLDLRTSQLWEDEFLNTATTGQLWKPFAQSSAFYVFPFFNIQSKVLVLFTHFSR